MWQKRFSRVVISLLHINGNSDTKPSPVNSFLARKYIREQVVSFSPFLDATDEELLKSELADLVESKCYATCRLYHLKLITHLCKDNTVLA